MSNKNSALHKALETEYAAIYTYETISPILQSNSANIAAMNLDKHYAASDALVYFLDQAKKISIPAVSYILPFPADNASHAIKLAIITEKECTQAYLILLQSSSEEKYKKFALDQLTQATIRLAHWNKIDNNYPIITPLPGQ